MTHSDTLRCISFLSPSLPAGLFEAIVEHLGNRLGIPTSLRLDHRRSGPLPDDADPFQTGEAELGFLCSPAYLWLRERHRGAVELVPAGLVFADPRVHGRPEYFADVVVRADDPARSFEELAGRRWAFNDRASLSGYFALLERLETGGLDASFLGEMVPSGSHLESIRHVLGGDVDATPLDSNVLNIYRAAHPEEATRLRVIESLGPYPIQPVVARATLAAERKRAIAEALLEAHESPATAAALARFGVARFVPVDDTAYAEEERFLRHAWDLLRRAGGPGCPVPGGR